MSIDLYVPDGSTDNPGFAVQGGPSGLTIGVGRAGQDTSLFGVANDQNGALINVLPLPVENGVLALNLWVCAPGEYPISALLGAYLTLSRRASLGGALAGTVFEDVGYNIYFSPALDNQDGTYRNTIVTAYGDSALRVNSYYRLVMHWADHVVGSTYYYRSIDTIDFQTGTVDYEIVPFNRHTNLVAHEW